MSFISISDVRMCKFADVQMKNRTLPKLFCLLLFASIIAVTACDTTGYVAIATKEGDMTGACDTFNIYQLFYKREGQKEAIPAITVDSITKQLYSSCLFIESHPEYKSSVAISCYINCKGELFKCASRGRRGDPVLREEVVAVFRTIENWTPGNLNGEIVDCVQDFRVDVNRGVVTVTSANLY